MNPIKWLTRRGSVATTNRAVAAPNGFPRLERSERFDIDLVNGRLGFINPASNLSDQDYWKGFAWDRRPFVNARSGAEFSENPDTGRYSCPVYETGWGLPMGAAPTQRQAVLKLSLFLDRPSRAERGTYPDLTEEAQLKAWLDECYVSRKQSFDRLEMEMLPDGTLAIGEHPTEQRLSHQEAVPLHQLDQPVCGRPVFRVFMNPGIIEFNLARNPMEVVQLRFQLLPQGPDRLEEALQETTLRFASDIVSSVTLE